MNPRWNALVNYRTDTGADQKKHELSEIRELHEIIERGPHWDTIEKIEIVRVNHIDSPSLTVEQAQQI